MKNEIQKKILKNQNLEINKILQRLMLAEQRVESLERNCLWIEQDQNWQAEDIKEIKEKLESLEQSLNTISLEKMVFNQD